MSVGGRPVTDTPHHNIRYASQRAQEEDSVVRAITIALAITGALALSGIAASARAEQNKCNPIGRPSPGYTGPYAYAAEDYYRYPGDCRDVCFYLATTF